MIANIVSDISVTWGEPSRLGGALKTFVYDFA